MATRVNKITSFTFVVLGLWAAGVLRKAVLPPASCSLPPYLLPLPLLAECPQCQVAVCVLALNWGAEEFSRCNTVGKIRNLGVVPHKHSSAISHNKGCTCRVGLCGNILLGSGWIIREVMHGVGRVRNVMKQSTWGMSSFWQPVID